MTDHELCAIPLGVEDRHHLEYIINRRHIFFRSFEIYGGYGGLYDLGPIGCMLKNQILQLWRNEFVARDNLFEISSTNLTPYKILETSGHVARFTDYMVSDPANNCYRADKLIEDHIENCLKAMGSSIESAIVNEDSFETVLEKKDPVSESDLRILYDNASKCNKDSMAAIIRKLEIKSPLTKESLSEPSEFNLMLQSNLGPKQDKSSPCFLRPETAQGIFVNFRRLCDFNGGRMPFGCAQIGLGFRNEISPRNGLIRLREFDMAEIEYFIDPQDAHHPNFPAVSSYKLPLFSRQKQIANESALTNMTLEEALATGLIKNQCLAYFMGRTFDFLLKCGIRPEGLRFRQHLSSELAHYASDCWDAEIHVSYGWIECVGHADRAAYDLAQHAQHTYMRMSCARTLQVPKERSYRVWKIHKKKLIIKEGPIDQNSLENEINNLTEEESLKIESELENSGLHDYKTSTGQVIRLKRSMLKFTTKVVKDTLETYTPNVIEPSFGISRILYCILEHNFVSRRVEDQEQKCYLNFSPQIAPVKASILPISSKAVFASLKLQCRSLLANYSITFIEDSASASIGKRYARTDEVGIPFAITIDFKSLEDGTVTLRERNTTAQVRLTLTQAVDSIRDMVFNTLKWTDVQKTFPAFTVEKKDEDSQYIMEKGRIAQ